MSIEAIEILLVTDRGVAKGIRFKRRFYKGAEEVPVAVFRISVRSFIRRGHVKRERESGVIGERSVKRAAPV